MKSQKISRLILFSLSPQETLSLGEQFGRFLSPGLVVGLYGELGAGKTRLVQGIAKGLQVQDHYITSPTFTILNEYRGLMPVYHFDVYRLSGPEELEELGYEEYFYGTGVTIIEWAEKIKPLLPKNYIKILLKHQGAEIRKLSLEANGAKGENFLGRFRAHVFLKHVLPLSGIKNK